MKLITEINENILFETVDKDLYVSGIFSSANVKNKNGRVYEKKILDREISKVMEQVKNATLYGQLNHPDKPEVDLERVAIRITELNWKDNDVIGKAKVLRKTYCGGILSGIIEDGGRVGISSRGLGTVNESGYVNEDYNLICWDIVSDASNPGSQFVNGIYEGREFGVSSGISLKEANEKAFKHIWQVLKKIEKEL